MMNSGPSTSGQSSPIQVPTLVMNRTGIRSRRAMRPAPHGAHITGARFRRISRQYHSMMAIAPEEGAGERSRRSVRRSSRRIDDRCAGDGSGSSTSQARAGVERLFGGQRVETRWEGYYGSCAARISEVSRSRDQHGGRRHLAELRRPRKGDRCAPRSLRVVHLARGAWRPA